MRGVLLVEQGGPVHFAVVGGDVRVDVGGDRERPLPDQPPISAHETPRRCQSETGR